MYLCTYAAAIVTNPKLKWQSFEQKSLETAHRAKQAVLSLWQGEYLTPAHLDNPHLPGSSQPNLEPQSARWHFENWITLQHQRPDENQEDSYHQYCTRPCYPNCTGPLVTMVERS